MRGLLIALAALVLAAGCAASQSTPNTSPVVAGVTPTPEPPAAASPSEAASAAPAASDPLRASAGVAYLAAANSYNATIISLYNQYLNATALDLLDEYCVKLGANEQAFLTTVKAIPVPADTVADVEALTGDLATDVANIKPCAEATSVEKWKLAWNRRNSQPDHTTEHANLVRKDLGLPPSPTPTPSPS